MSARRCKRVMYTPRGEPRRWFAAACAIALLPAPCGTARQPPGDAIVIERVDENPQAVALWSGFPELRPPLRGFKAPILDTVNDPWPFALAPTATARQRTAAHGTAERLARDGLLAAVAFAVEALGPADLPARDEDALRALRDVGVPVDLLACFSLPQAPRSDAASTVRYITERLAAADTPASLQAELSAARFEFPKSPGGYLVATESGEHDIGAVRMQATRGTYWNRRGAGGNLDVMRQLIELLPESDFLVSIDDTHLAEFLSTAGAWQLHQGQMKLMPQPLPVTQWAQDNGKAGISTAADGSMQIATIVPRYASQREDGSLFIAGDAHLTDVLARSGHAVVHSPLLFQGGNLLAVRDAGSGQRVLLVGEAEIYRNVALGLTPGQVEESLRVEFGVDRCVVLPSVSFHIDFDMTVRSTADECIVFVNDPLRGARIIVETCVGALRDQALVDPATASALQALLDDDDLEGFATRITPVIETLRVAPGRYRLSAAEALAADAADSGVGNLQQFLVAIDLLRSSTEAPAVEAGPLARHERAYLQSLKRRRADRLALHALLEGLGWRVIAVPSLSEVDRSVNYVNGVQTRGTYFMPAHGGLFSPLDDAAASVFLEVLGPTVQVQPVLCAESQRRAGGVHCSLSAYPRITRPDA